MKLPGASSKGRSFRTRLRRMLVHVRRRVPPGLRLVLGLLLICGGILGFLPILGFWMIPVGLLVLSVDSPLVRRRRRRVEVRYARWRRSRKGGDGAAESDRTPR